MDTGLIIMVSGFGVPIVGIIIIWLWLRIDRTKMLRIGRELNQRKEKAYPMNAKIIEANVGVQGGGIRKIVFFKLEILDNAKPYNAEAAWFVETFSFSQAQPGEVISVKVDVDNPQIIYPDVSWAVYTEGYDKNMSVRKLEEDLDN